LYYVVSEIAEITSRSALWTAKTIELQNYYTSFFIARARGEKSYFDFEIDFVASLTFERNCKLE